MTGLPKTREALDLLEGAMRFPEDVCMHAEIAPAALAEVEAAEAVIAAARDVSMIERTGVLPDFQPLADALARLDGEPTERGGDESGGAPAGTRPTVDTSESSTGGASPLSVGSCQHGNQLFSRTICACGWMHTYCTDCNTQLEPCDDDTMVQGSCPCDGGDPCVC